MISERLNQFLVKPRFFDANTLAESLQAVGKRSVRLQISARAEPPQTLPPRRNISFYIPKHSSRGTRVACLRPAGKLPLEERGGSGGSASSPKSVSAATAWQARDTDVARAVVTLMGLLIHESIFLSLVLRNTRKSVERPRVATLCPRTAGRVLGGQIIKVKSGRSRV